MTSIARRTTESLGKRLTLATTAVAALAVLYTVMPFESDLWWLGALLGVIVVLSILPWTYRRVKEILISDRPFLDGAIVVGLIIAMLVLSFSMTFYAIAHHNPGAFQGLDTKIDSLYFVVTTLGTVGYGDIHPVGQWARAVVTMQILFNFAMIGLVIRVVASAAQHRMRETESGPTHMR